MNVTLASLHESDLPFLYQKFKEGLQDVSTAAFGWDESYQHDRFMKAYRLEWFYSIKCGSQKIGYLCFQADNKDLHVHLLINFKE